MAQFTHSLCEEVIRTEGGCGLSRNEITQMARLALRQLKAENPLMRDYLRYRFLRDQEPLGTGPGLFLAMRADGRLIQMTHDFADHRIDEAMTDTGPDETQRSDAAHDESSPKEK